MSLYTKINAVPMIPWTDRIDMINVSISFEDEKKGSPKEGDMIAFGTSPSDRWLIEETVFKQNYQEVKILRDDA